MNEGMGVMTTSEGGSSIFTVGAEAFAPLLDTVTANGPILVVAGIGVAAVMAGFAAVPKMFKRFVKT